MFELFNAWNTCQYVWEWYFSQETKPTYSVIKSQMPCGGDQTPQRYSIGIFFNVSVEKPLSILKMNKNRYQDAFFILYHELANLHIAQRNEAERKRVDYCVELLHEMDRAVNQK